MAKEMLPEFERGIGAGRVHLESTRIADEWLINRASKNGDNFVIPWVGKNIDKIRGLVRDARNEGYSVYLHLNELGNDKAARRAVKRYLKDGRFVDPDYIKGLGDTPSKTYEALKKEGLFDGYTKYSNDVPYGEKPRLVEETGEVGMAPVGGTGGRPQLVDEIQTGGMGRTGRGHDIDGTPRGETESGARATNKPTEIAGGKPAPSLSKSPAEGVKPKPLGKIKEKITDNNIGIALKGTGAKKYFEKPAGELGTKCIK